MCECMHMYIQTYAHNIYETWVTEQVSARAQAPTDTGSKGEHAPPHWRRQLDTPLSIELLDESRGMAPIGSVRIAPGSLIKMWQARGAESFLVYDDKGHVITDCDDTQADIDSADGVRMPSHPATLTLRLRFEEAAREQCLGVHVQHLSAAVPSLQGMCAASALQVEVCEFKGKGRAKTSDLHLAAGDVAVADFDQVLRLKLSSPDAAPHHLQVYLCICVYVYMYICIHVYMYICIHVHMYICIDTYTRI